MGKSNEFSKEELEKFLNFIEDVASRSGNEWFGRCLIQRLGSQFPIKSSSLTSENSQIKDIYEYCVANVLEQQAMNMYKWVEDINLRETLIVDFIRMEKFRREDRFEDFCLAAYQQIEAMVNFILNKYSEYQIRGEREIHEPAFSKYSSVAKKILKAPGKTVGGYLFGNKYSQDEGLDVIKSIQRPFYKWEAFQRVKFMVYYHYYNGEMSYADVEPYFSLFRNLKIMRDSNHRNTEVVDDRKAIDIENIRATRSMYYIRFSDLLYRFCVWSTRKSEATGEVK